MICSYLEKLHSEYLEEKINIDKAIVNLQVQLRENKEFIKLLEDSTDITYESFSPRDINAKSKLQLKELKEKQNELLQEIDELKVNQDEVLHKIDELENVIEMTKSLINKDLESNADDLYESDVYRLKLLEAEENERQRISRELHDSTVQNLTAIVHKTELCSKLIDIDPIRCRLELNMMSRTLRDIINDTRKMIYNLRPMSFDDIGLEITIERALDKIKNDMSCNIGFLVEGEPYNIKPVVGITILRIIQEACNNAIKHSEASNIQVKLIYDKSLFTVQIDDNGKGFSLNTDENVSREDNSGFGLSMMKERIFLLSGELVIESAPGKGCCIKAQIPVEEEN